MKLCLILLIPVSGILCTSSAFAQKYEKRNYDSLWYFHPFSIELLLGAWTPAGKLSNFYTTSPQFGAGLGLMISRKARLQLLMMPRILIPQKPILVNINNTTIELKERSVEASIGGGLSHTLYQGKSINTELLTAITFESIQTSIKKSNTNDSLAINGLGVSLGINSWINKFNNHNVGIRTLYTYATFDASKHLASSIGRHSFTFSLIYRFPKRNQKNKRWYLPISNSNAYDYSTSNK